MAPSYSPASYRAAPGPRAARRRTVALALAVAAHLLLIWLLFHLSPSLRERDHGQPTLTTFDVAREPGSKPKAAAPRKQVAQAHAAARAARPAAERRQQAQRPPAPAPPDLSLFGHNALFAGGDVGRIPAQADEGEVADSGAGSGRTSGSTYGPGAGPGGARLYAAEWYRHPTHAELAGYLPGHDVPPGSWGDIACRTIPGNQVENCQSLGESPPGSGIARALRQAAWQFRIVPPRVDGKPMIGAWVRIHFFFTDGGDVEAK